MKKNVEQKKFCGNCRNHNTYEYPSKMFCIYRFLNHLDPIVSTLSCCENWQSDTQSCLCVEKALEKLNNKERIKS